VKYSAIVLAAALSALPLAARAQKAFIPANKLVQVCNNPAQDAICTGFIGGALDEVIASPARTEICVPSGTSLKVLRAALVKYAREHADQTKGSGVSLLNAMIKANYPCAAQ
jgi:Rap1a immunity proteins